MDVYIEQIVAIFLILIASITDLDYVNYEDVDRNCQSSHCCYHCEIIQRSPVLILFLEHSLVGFILVLFILAVHTYVIVSIFFWLERNQRFLCKCICITLYFLWFSSSLNIKLVLRVFIILTSFVIQLFVIIWIGQLFVHFCTYYQIYKNKL